MLRWVGVCVFAALLAGGGYVRAAQEEVYLDYSATEGCPTRQQFEAQVRARTALAQFVDFRGSGRFFSVYAGLNAGIAVGRVTSGRGEQVGSAREVSSNRCEDVVSALALIVALAIDPHASIAPLLPPAAKFPSEPTPPPAAVKPAAQSPPMVERVAKPPPPDTRAGMPRSDDRPRVRPRVARRDAPGAARDQLHSTALLFGVRTGGSIWLGSPLVPMLNVAASLEANALGTTELAPSVRVSVEHSVSSTVHPPNGGGAQFAITMASFDLCPLRVPMASSVAIRMCAGLEGGRLTGRGLQEGPVDNPETQHRPWWAARQSARLQFQIGSGWQAEIETGLIEPLWRDWFVFLLGATPTGVSPVLIVRAPPVVPRLNLGLTLRFW